MNRARPIALAAAAAVLVAALGALMTDLGPWYQQLKQPPWKPPDASFGPIWTLIFALAAAAGVSGWQRLRLGAERRRLLLLFALNGGLNVFWSLLYFRLHRPDWALAEVPFLWLSVLALMAHLARRATSAALLLAPYLVWVAIAACLNWQTVHLNAPFTSS